MADFECDKKLELFFRCRLASS